MISLPKLGTGSIALYPIKRTDQYRTEVLRFLDGSDQRFSEQTRPITRLALEYSMLTEAEATKLADAIRMSLVTGEPLGIEGITWGPEVLLVHPVADHVRLRYEAEDLVSLTLEVEEF